MTATFTPEEKEDDELNTHTAYAFGKQDDTNCQKIIETYRTDLLPAAQNAKFPKNKSKYLFIAHQSMGECQMKQGRYIEAEQSYRDALAQADVWPGKEDSSYAEMWSSLGVAQMKQDHNQDAEASLQKSADAYQVQIDAKIKANAALKGDDAERAQKSLRYEQRNRAAALTGAGYLYFRDGDLDGAQKAIEQAYQDAVAGHLTGDTFQGILMVGSRVAEQRGDAAEVAKWAARADTTAQLTPETSPSK